MCDSDTRLEQSCVVATTAAIHQSPPPQRVLLCVIRPRKQHNRHFETCAPKAFETTHSFIHSQRQNTQRCPSIPPPDYPSPKERKKSQTSQKRQPLKPHNIPPCSHLPSPSTAHPHTSPIKHHNKPPPPTQAPKSLPGTQSTKTNPCPHGTNTPNPARTTTPKKEPSHRSQGPDVAKPRSRLPPPDTNKPLPPLPRWRVETAFVSSPGVKRDINTGQAYIERARKVRNEVQSPVCRKIVVTSFWGGGVS